MKDRGTYPYPHVSLRIIEKGSGFEGWKVSREGGAGCLSIRTGWALSQTVKRFLSGSSSRLSLQHLFLKIDFY